jgi:hypothetical protein
MDEEALDLLLLAKFLIIPKSSSLDFFGEMS